MAKQSKREYKRNSGITIAMNKRFPRKQVITHRMDKRSGDVKNN